MTYQQREEYSAPVCEALVFEVEESITAPTSLGQANPEFGIGQDAEQEDD